MISKTMRSDDRHLPQSGVNDYHKVAAAIRYMTQNTSAQPQLKDLADHLHLSETHCQRLFSRWVGISPKRFLQYLTLEHSRALLREDAASMLDVTIASGLSSVSRIHDLYVQCEAITPGEYKRLGAGLAIDYGFHATPFGECLAAINPRGLCGLLFIDGSRAGALDQLRRTWPRARLRQADEVTAGVVERIFFHQWDSSQPLYLNVKGTNFQIQVWQALLRIPEGAQVAYQSVADHIDRPSSVRAVASAIGENPVHYLIPCHRVVRKDGHLGGYRGGLTRKRALLAWEAAHR